MKERLSSDRVGQMGCPPHDLMTCYIPVARSGLFNRILRFIISFSNTPEPRLGEGVGHHGFGPRSKPPRYRMMNEKGETEFAFDIEFSARTRKRKRKRKTRRICPTHAVVRIQGWSGGSFCIGGWSGFVRGCRPMWWSGSK